MAGENVVSIVVKADDETSAGFAGAKAGAAEAGAGMDEYAAATERVTKAETELRDAQIRETDAQLKLAEIQASDGGASAAKLAAAQDRVTKATLASLDAQIRLTEAEGHLAEVEARAGDAAAAQGAKTETSGGMFAGAGSKMKMAAVGIAVGLGLAVKSAADFQQQTTKLVTSAGESAKNLGAVQQGILQLSSATNTSTEQLASGMYMVESPGFHGAEGLKVLKAAAEGAQAEGADLSEVANAVTSGLNAYGMKAKDATAFTDQMVAAVGAGKMTMQDLASSLSAVLPIAASAHISFAQVGGAIATMTSQGMSARQAAQDLANSIRSLLNPNSVAINEMNQFGVSSVSVARNLGKEGLTGTIGELASAITSHMGPAGVVIMNTFNQSRTAAADAQMMLGNLPPAIKKVAQAYLDGSITQKQWTTDLKAMPPLQANLASEFATVANKAHGFNDLLKSGNPVAQTFAAALGKMMGGATGLNTALMLTGSHAATFNANVKAVGDASKGAGSDVAGWNIIQKETNFQLGSAEKAIKAMGMSLGMTLLPYVNDVLHPLTEFTGLIAGNKAASIAFAAVIGGVLAGALGSKLAGAFRSVKEGITAFSEGLTSLIAKFGATAAAEEGTAAATGELDAAMDANPIMLIVLAIAALAAGFAYLWTHVAGFRVFWEDVWRVIKAAWDLFADDIKLQIHIVASVIDIFREAFVHAGHDIEAAVDAVVNFVKDHWKLLAAIILGPLRLIIDALATHWKAVKVGFKEAWDFVSGVVRTAIGVVKSIIDPYIKWNEAIFRAGWDAVKTVFNAAWSWISGFVKTEVNGIEVILGWFGKLGSLFHGWWDDAVNAVRTQIDSMVGWVEKIPGRINSALGGLPGMLFKAGVNAIQALINGIESMFGAVGNVVGSLASKIAGFFGLSPAKEGPLSGGGAPQIRGQHFAADIAAGIMSGRDLVASAASRVAGAAAIGPGGGYGGAGIAAGTQGPAVIQIAPMTGGSGLDQQFWQWLRNGIRAKGGNVQVVLGHG